jgi:hypothetical protein
LACSLADYFTNLRRFHPLAVLQAKNLVGPLAESHVATKDESLTSDDEWWILVNETGQRCGRAFTDIGKNVVKNSV